MRGLLTPLRVLLAAFVTWAPAAAQSGSSVLQALAQKAGCNEQAGALGLTDAQAARCLFKAWYPDMHVKHGMDPNNKDVAETYGELEPEGVEELLDRVAELGAPLSADDVFADLGSGVGQIALLVFLKTLVRQVVGIELVQERYDFSVTGRENALQALSVLESDADYHGEVPAGDRDLTLLRGDIRDPALYKYWAAATVVFTCSILFPDELMSDLNDAFIANLEPGTLIFSLNRIPGDNRGLAPLTTYRTKTSWERVQGAKVFLYIKNLEPLVLTDLNLAIGKSQALVDDCISWGTSKGGFATEKVLWRFCNAFTQKWSQRAQYGHPRVDYDWVVPEL